MFGVRRPKDRVRGSDVAGIVEAVGSKVTRFAPGDEVFGSGIRTLAEYAPAAEKDLAPKPANVTFEQAAAVSMAGLTAFQAIRVHGKVSAGQKVLIVGAGGGIGSFAVQIARAAGAEVTGVCSTGKLELVRSIGADHVIDYTQEDFTRRSERYDFILDNASRRPLSAMRRLLTPKGMLIPNCGEFEHRWLASTGTMLRASLTSPFASQTLRPLLSVPKTEDLLALGELMQAGSVTPVIDRVYPLAEAPAALAHVGAGHASGKVVVAI
jgi:NADPH:quinone reductase-like Zn-dependent oxidoreductase